MFSLLVVICMPYFFTNIDSPSPIGVTSFLFWFGYHPPRRLVKATQKNDPSSQSQSVELDFTPRLWLLIQFIETYSPRGICSLDKNRDN